MTTSHLDKGLIYTDGSNCVGCNNCIRECPELKANVVVKDSSGINKIHLDSDPCILCGTCIGTCTHGVRKFHDDWDSFLDGLRSGRSTSVLIAPALLLNYPKQYKRILGYLKSLGVNKFYSVSYGADITTWAYLNYIQKERPLGNMSQPCPVVVSYLEKHDNDKLDWLIPIQSPMMCMAIYLKKYMGVTDDLAFLSPCIAKKIEIQSSRGQGMIKHNVTFVRLMEHIREQRVNINSFPELDDEIEYGMGSLFPVPGGLRENVEFYLGYEALVFQVEGEHHLYDYLQKAPSNWRDRVSETPALIDALNCGRGCNYGTATEFRLTNNDYVQIESFNLKKQKREALQKEDGGLMLEPAERFAMLNDKFKHLNMSDFKCTYNRHPVKSRYIQNDEVERIFADMLKFSDFDKTIDCCSCGYATCMKMALAIGHGINDKDNCVYYAKAILQQKSEYQQQVMDKFGEISQLLDQLNNDNVSISTDANSISEKVDTAVNSGNELRDRLTQIQEEFKKLSALQDGIVNIARSTNMLSINAIIEAAHAGNYGKGFTVVAEEMGNLAKKTMDVANQSKKDSDSVFGAMDKLVESTYSLIGQIDGISGGAGEINDSVMDITAKTEEIVALMDSLKE